MTYDVGDTAKLTLTVNPFDDTTDVTLVVTAPDGTTSSPSATTADGGATWTALGPATMPGAWLVRWTATGTGANVEDDEYEVDPIPPPSAEQRQVRLLISDTDKANRIFSTLQLADFLAMNGDSVRRAAAQALDTIAANEAMVSKKIRTQDLQTDGPAVAAELRAAATELRRQADDSEGDLDDIGFEIVEYRPYPYHAGWRY